MTIPDFAFDEDDYQVRCAEKRATREADSARDLFCPISLGDWLDLCRVAGVPHVPALLIGEAPLEAVLRFDEEEFAAPAAPFYAGLREWVADLGPGWMLRWDCCAMAEVKYNLSEGRPDWRPEFSTLYADDFRAYDILSEFPRSTIKAWARPWMTFDLVGGHPVEYRAFVENERVVGVSSYYPQRPLDAHAGTWQDIQRVTAMAERLIRVQGREMLCPRPSGFDLTRNHWTADFARLPSGAILFLEGGPPHTPRGGAHMCCFRPGEIDGIALADRNEARA